MQHILDIAVPVAALLLFAGASTAQGIVSAPRAITSDDLKARLGAFAHDSMRGRRTGSPEQAKGAQFIVRALQSRGIKAAGANGRYVDDVPIVEVQLSQHDARLFVTEEEPSFPVNFLRSAFRPGIDFQPAPGVAGLPFRRTADVRNCRVVFGGTLGARNALDPLRVVGDVILFLPPTRPDGSPDYQWWRMSDQIRKYQGAAAILIAALDITPPAVVQRFNEPHLELEQRGALQDKAFPPIAIVTHFAGSVLLNFNIDSARVGYHLLSVSLVFDVKRRSLRAPTQNVVAIIEGGDARLKSEIVMLSAHLDGPGVATRVNEQDPFENPQADSILNGADEGGTGAIALLTLADHIASLPSRPKRSILFLWTVGEEQGLLGSKWFTEHSTVARERIVAAVNVDMIGRGGSSDIANGGPDYLQIIGTPRVSTELGAWLDSVNGGPELKFRLESPVDSSTSDTNAYCNGDHWNFARWGIPSLLITTGIHSDYRKPTDDADRIDYGKYARVTRFVVAFAMDIANRASRPLVDKPKPNSQAICEQ